MLALRRSKLSEPQVAERRREHASAECKITRLWPCQPTANKSTGFQTCFHIKACNTFSASRACQHCPRPIRHRISPNLRSTCTCRYVLYINCCMFTYVLLIFLYLHLHVYINVSIHTILTLSCIYTCISCMTRHGQTSWQAKRIVKANARMCLWHRASLCAGEVANQLVWATNPTNAYK